MSEAVVISLLCVYNIVQSIINMLVWNEVKAMREELEGNEKDIIDLRWKIFDLEIQAVKGRRNP